jgi:hypothetical protein
MSKPGADRLYEMLSRNHALAERMDEAGFELEAFTALQKWQQARLAQSFEDLYRQPGYRSAVDFFLTDIYGGLDFRKRDQDMSRVMPVMVRFLPDRALNTMSEAFELQAISLEFDMDMAAWMEAHGIRSLDMRQYGEVYRACSERRGRERQIELIRKLGYDLDNLVRKSFVNHLVRLLRGPAHAAGFGDLQEFLEGGLESFRTLEDIEYFVETIYEREWAAMQRLFAGEDQPFGF